MIRTVSPSFAEFSSSCALSFLVRVIIFPYTGCFTRRSIATTTVFSILSLTTVPVRTLRALRVSSPSVVSVILLLPLVLHRLEPGDVAPDERRRNGFSNVSVPERNVSRKRSSSSSLIFATTSESIISRISSAFICMRLLTLHELRLHTQLRRSKRHCLLRNLQRHTFQLEHHTARLHHGHPTLGRTLSLTHARLCRLLRNRLVGEDANPHLSL